MNKAIFRQICKPQSGLESAVNVLPQQVVTAETLNDGDIVAVVKQTGDELVNAEAVADRFRLATVDMIDVVNEADSALEQPLPEPAAKTILMHRTSSIANSVGDVLEVSAMESAISAIGGLESVMSTAKQKVIEYFNAFIAMMKHLGELIKKYWFERNNLLVQKRKTWKELKATILARSRVKSPLKRKHQSLSLTVTFFSETENGAIYPRDIRDMYVKAGAHLNDVIDKIGVLSHDQSEWVIRGLQSLASGSTAVPVLDLKAQALSYQLPGFYLIDCVKTNKAVLFNLRRDIPTSFVTQRDVDVFDVTSMQIVAEASDALFSVLDNTEAKLKAISANIEKQRGMFTAIVNNMVKAQDDPTAAARAQLQELMSNAKHLYSTNLREISDLTAGYLNRLERLLSIMLAEYY